MEIKKLFISLILGLGLTLALLWLLDGGLTVVRAADFTVNTTTDENDGGCTDGDCSLRDAIIIANGNGQADTITLGSGTYALTLTGTGENNAATGDLDITDVLTITGAGPSQTIIDASGVISDRVLDIRSGAGTVVISGVTVINGNVTGWGGGIYNYNADLTLINTIVVSNTASSYGGGVASNRGNVTLSGTQVVSNTAKRGGGVYIAYNPGSFTQTGDSAIAYNGVIGTGFDGSGAGVYVDSASAMLEGGQIFSNTSSSYGGGMFVGSGSATLSGTQIFSNTAGYGGGVHLRNGSGTLNVSGGEIVSNTALFGGGGVYIFQGNATLSGGQILGNEADEGGGVYVYDGSATLSGGQIVSNTAASEGGGVYVHQSTAVFTQTGDSIIAHNSATGTATGAGGGGVYVWYGNATLSGGQVASNTASYGGGVYVSSSSGTFTQTGVSTIAHNTAITSGGGVYVDNGSMTLSRGQIVSNTASNYGGGVFVDNGSATLSGGQILDNNASRGGGVYVNTSSATLNASGGQISSNTTSGDGGGLYVDQGSATLSRTPVVSNTARDGGGIYNSEGTLTLVNTTVSHNATTVGDGGGIYNDEGTAVLTYTTVASNTAANRIGGIEVGGATVFVQDTIVAYNSRDNCTSGGLTSNGYNLDSGNTCGFSATGDQQNTDPLLGPLADNGGDTLTHALLGGSPAIDKGTCVAGITTDQRGVTRPQGDDCDMGAYEYAQEGGAVYLPLIMRSYP